MARFLTLLLLLLAIPARGGSIPEWVYWNWGFDSTYTPEADIDAVAAWHMLKNPQPVKVAVVDTGIDLTHPDLKDHVDPQSLSFVGDRGGSVNDYNGHGSHVSGLVLGASGYNANILSLKFYDESNTPEQNAKNTVAAFEFAISAGARIVNYSAGGGIADLREYRVLEKAELAGVLVVVPAGNSPVDIGHPKNHYYPASYRLPNMIVVAATNERSKLTESSGWGYGSVDVAAPGYAVVSTHPTHTYARMSGTSQATAYVSGLAAMLLAENPKLTAAELKAIIEGSVDVLPALKNKVKTEGRINSLKALMKSRSFFTRQKK